MDPFVGEIRLIPFNFAPQGWLPCDGRLLPINQNVALFSLLGITYGGNGTQNFALPDLRGRAIVGMGQGTGLTNYQPGTAVGAESVTLDATTLPTHNHSLSATVPVSTEIGTSNSPAGSYFAQSSSQYSGEGGAGNMAAGLLNGSTGQAGGTQAHENRMPFLALNYCIATQGIFPQRP